VTEGIFIEAEFGLNETNRPFVKWRSTGPERGKVTVKSGDDLMIDRSEWPTVDGVTVHVGEQKLNIWTADEKTDPLAIYNVTIKNEEKDEKIKFKTNASLHDGSPVCRECIHHKR